MNRPPCIITVALTGNVPTKKMNPNLPVTPEEIASQAISCYKAGASIIHVHVRDENEKPTQNLDYYRKVVKIVKKEAPNLIIQLTTGGRSGKSPQLRMDVVRLCPEMASFTTGSNNMAKIIYENSPDFILKLAKTFHDTKVTPEIECFDSGHIDNAIFLAKRKKLLSWPLHFNFVLGVRGSAPATVETLNFFKSKIDKYPDCTWNCCGLGWNQFNIAAAAIAMNGHVRVGLEDMIYMPDGEMATNLKMVQKVVRLCKELNRPIATPDQARQIIGLKPENKDRILKYVDKKIPIHPVDYSVLKGNFEYKIDDLKKKYETIINGLNKKINNLEKNVIYQFEKCNICGKKCETGCNGCKKVYYCSEKCQISDWNNHKNQCV